MLTSCIILCMKIVYVYIHTSLTTILQLSSLGCRVITCSRNKDELADRLFEWNDQHGLDVQGVVAGNYDSYLCFTANLFDTIELLL